VSDTQPSQQPEKVPSVVSAREHEIVVAERDYFREGTSAGLRAVDRIRELEGEVDQLRRMLTEGHRMVLTMSGQTNAVIMALEGGYPDALHLDALREHERAADALCARMNPLTRTPLGDWIVDDE
jgi:hypothetical protein